MAVSADHNEIIELTDLIEKGPGLPDRAAATSGPLPLPVEDAAPAALSLDGLPKDEEPAGGLPLPSAEEAPQTAPAAPQTPPVRDWEAQLDASAAAVGDAGLHLAALARQGGERPLPPEEDARLERLEDACRGLDQRLEALERQVPDRSGENLLMETVERLTHLEERLETLPAGEGAPGSMAAAPDSVLLMESMERLAGLEAGEEGLLRRIEALEGQAPADRSGENLLMESMERLTHLEEQVLALSARQEEGAPSATTATAGTEAVARLEAENRALAQRVEALEHQLADLMTDFDKYVEKAAAAAAARILHEEIRRLMAEQA